MIATVAAHRVASSAVPTIAVGRVEPADARSAIAVAGINCTDAVLIARKVHIALEATPGRGLSCSKSRIARKPSGVAALPSPSMLAAMFMSIEPIAGCSGGTSGKRRRMIGCKARAIRWTSPARSANRITPSHSAMIPISPNAIVTAVFAPSNAPLVTSPSRLFQPPIATASTTNASQIQFSISVSTRSLRVSAPSPFSRQASARFLPGALCPRLRSGASASVRARPLS